jgi:hypothetical protein
MSHGNEGEYQGCDERPDIQTFMDEQTHYETMSLEDFMEETK